MVWGCWLVFRAVSTLRIRALDICYWLTASRAAQRSVDAPAFSRHLAKLECNVCVLSASLATAVLSATACELADALLYAHVSKHVSVFCACLSFINPN